MNEKLAVFATAFQPHWIVVVYVHETFKRVQDEHERNEACETIFGEPRDEFDQKTEVKNHK